MKKFFILFCFILIFLSACTSAKKIAEPTLPVNLRQSNELRLCLPGYQYLANPYMRAVNVYKQKYPDVEVILEIIGDPDEYPSDGSEYIKHIRNGIADGSGPDIILTTFLYDFYDLADDGAFLNLSHIMENDEEFDIGDFNENVINAGIYRGARYVMPLSYETNILLTDKKALERINFDLSRDTDFFSFFTEIVNCLPYAKDNPAFKRMFNEMLAGSLVNAAGLTIYDRENKNLLPLDDKTREFCEAYKPYYKTDIKEIYDFGYGFELIPAGDFYFEKHYGSQNIFYNYSRLKDLGFDPAFTAVRTMDGGLSARINDSLAIRYGAKNEANAWNFVKMMLSETIQYARVGWGQGFWGDPVNNKAFSRQIDEILRRGENIGFWSEERGGYQLFCPEIPDEEKAPYRELHEAVTNCTIGNAAIESYFFHHMTPFFEDVKSYEECINDFISAMDDFK